MDAPQRQKTSSHSSLEDACCRPSCGAPLDAGDDALVNLDEGAMCSYDLLGGYCASGDRQVSVSGVDQQR